MLFEDMTKAAVAESVLRLRNAAAKEYDDSSDVMLDVDIVRRLMKNTTPPRIPAEMSWDLQSEYRDEWIPLALARAIVNKLQSAMYGRGVEYEIKGQEKNVIIAGILDNWRRAAPDIYCHALEFGYCVIRFYPDKRKGLVYGVYDPDEVTPIFDPETEDLDPIALIYRYKVPIDTVPIAKAKNVQEAIVLEHITRHKRDRVTGDILIPGMRKRWFSIDNIKWREWPYSENETWLNPYGDHLGAVIWRNDSSVNGPWGMSDVLPVYDLLQAVSHTCTDLKLLLKWNLWPPIYSDSPGFADLPYSWRQMWELRAGDGGGAATVDRLDWDPAALTGGMDYLKLLLQMVYETTSVPAIAMGNMDGIGNLSSGRALEVVMMPLTDLTMRREKLQEWQEQQAVIEMLAVYAHAMVERTGGKRSADELKIMTVEYMGEHYPDAYQMEVTVSFGQIGLAGSSEDTVAYYTGLYASGLMSLIECLRGLHPSWTEKELLDEHDRIKASADSGEGTVVDEGRAARIQQMIDGTTQNE